MYLQANSVEKYYGDRKARVQVLKGISCEIARRIEQLVIEIMGHIRSSAKQKSSAADFL